jgi:DNA-directed RNA polymerase subunit RPC12/RpoP
MQTLAELASHFELFAVCIDCRRMVRIDLNELLQRLPGALTVEALRRRVRCRACGHRTGDIRIVYAGPCGSARGFHYRNHTALSHELTAAQSPSSSVPSRVNPKPATPT